MTTNPAVQLRAVIREHHLTRRATADLLGVSIESVHGWLAPQSNAKHRAMPPRYLTYLADALARK